MIKNLAIILVCVLCVGCTKMGSFEKGTIDLPKLYDKVLSEIEDKELQMGIMQDTAKDASLLEESYGIKPTEIQDYVIYQSVIPADCGEISIFHIKENTKVIQDGINRRIVQMKNEAALLAKQLVIIEGAQILEIGEYIVFVSGVDAQKVIQYISSL